MRIKNYRSIIDTGYWEIHDRIEALAGKNASGKSSIFEALQLFNPSLKVHLLSYGPIYEKKKETELRMQLEIELDEVNGRAREIVRYACDHEGIENETASIEIAKRIQPDGDVKYQINGKNMLYLVNKDLIQLNTIISTHFPTFDYLLPNKLDRKNMQGAKQKLARLSTLVDREFDENQENYTQEERGLLKKVNIITDMIINNRYQHVVQEFIPRFELFEFNKKDMIPDEIPYQQIPRHKIIRRMLAAMNLNISDLVKLSREENLSKERLQEIKEMLEDRDEGLESFMQASWMQSNITLEFIPNRNGIEFYIKEDGKMYRMSQRSGGETWFIAFISFFFGIISKDKPMVIIIDEPSNNLHPDAQKEILWMMDALMRKYGHLTILYCSHSPYMFDPEKLYRIARVIRTEERGTFIEKRPVLAYSAMESITPIMTAIGDNLAAGIRPDRRNNVITEGYTDYIYLITIKEIMAEELMIDEPLYIIPSLGAGKMPYIGTILLAWGLEPVFLVDNDQAGLITKRQLKMELNLPDEKIIVYPVESKQSIEDMFSKTDMKNLLNYAGVYDPEFPLDEGFAPYNGRYYEKYDVHISKRLLALTFKQHPFDLNIETRENFKKLFKEIHKAFQTTSRYHQKTLI